MFSARRSQTASRLPVKNPPCSHNSPAPSYFRAGALLPIIFVYSRSTVSGSLPTISPSFRPRQISSLRHLCGAFRIPNIASPSLNIPSAVLNPLFPPPCEHSLLPQNPSETAAGSVNALQTVSSTHDSLELVCQLILTLDDPRFQSKR